MIAIRSHISVFNRLIILHQDVLRPYRQDNCQGNNDKQQPYHELRIPLLMARVSTYHKQTDTKLINQIEINSNDDKMRQIVIFQNESQCNEWLDEIVRNIAKENLSYITEFNDHSKSDHHLHMIGWVSERNSDANNVVIWKPGFLVLQGQQLKIYKSPPLGPSSSNSPATAAELEINLYETLFRSHATTDKLLDKRQHCFSVQYSTNQVVYCNVNNQDELKLWADAFHDATHKAVYHIQTKTYSCTWEDRDCELTIDFEKGFILREKSSKNQLWAYKFSQLKSSSDDGQTTINFTFHNNSSFERQGLRCEKAYQLLFCVHAFLEAKIALIDPQFLATLANGDPLTPKSPSVSYNTPNVAPKTPMAPRLVLDGKSPS